MNLTDNKGGGESDVDSLEAWWGSAAGTQVAFTLGEEVHAAPVRNASIDFIPVKIAAAKDTFEIRLRPPKP